MSLLAFVGKLCVVARERRLAIRVFSLSFCKVFTVKIFSSGCGVCPLKQSRKFSLRESAEVGRGAFAGSFVSFSTGEVTRNSLLLCKAATIPV